MSRHIYTHGVKLRLSVSDNGQVRVSLGDTDISRACRSISIRGSVGEPWTAELSMFTHVEGVDALIETLDVDAVSLYTMDSDVASGGD
jgi:hypothetical protein